MIISRYGLHIAPGDIAFLVQPAGATNLISSQLRSPFEPHIRPRSQRCPHDIDLFAEAPHPTWLDEPLARVFIPTPRAPGEKPSILYDPDGRHDALLQSLARLSSPTEPLTRPIWWKLPRALTASYTVTNLGPLVWTSAELSHVRDVYKHISMAEGFDRRVLIVTRDRLPIFGEAEDVEPFTLPAGEPLEAIGAGALRERMSTGT